MKNKKNTKHETKSIVIDIIHYPHFNFFKNIIKILKAENININIVFRPRGNLNLLLENEFPDTQFVKIGLHRKSIFGKVHDLIERDFRLLKYLMETQPDACVSVGSINLAHASFILKKPSICFVDDMEHKLAYNLVKPFSTYFVVPKCVPASGKNVIKYNGFKELAYLHPNYFVPNKNILDQYNVKPNEYVFIREVSNSSLNYKNLEEGKLSTIIHYLNDLGFKILLSVENKRLTNLFENHCIILKEPVEDIHSLLSYAALTISSGDSMARESCLLGTPAIYTGGREMAINNELIRRHFMFKSIVGNELSDLIEYIINNDVKKKIQYDVNWALKYEWVDTNEVFYNILTSTLEGDNSLIEKYKIN